MSDGGPVQEKDSLRIPIIVSAIWMLIAVGIILSRASDFWDLKLNEMGDVLAGVFAPLAFFWLFVATSLQRRELRLQRIELANTRAVMDEQRHELKRSVEESNKQTEIMQRTVEAAQSRDVYDEFKLRLYYLAKYIEDYRRSRGLLVREGKDSVNSVTYFHRIFLEEGPEISENDTTSVDRLFHGLETSFGIPFEIRREMLVMDEKGLRENFRALHYLGYIKAKLSDLLNDEYYQRVPLVAARTQALGLKHLHQRIKDLYNELSAALAPEPHFTRPSERT